MVEKNKRAIIVGIGSHARSWKTALELHPDWELAAVIDTDTEKLEHAAESWGVDEDETFTSIEEAMQFGEGPYDLAIIVTPIYTHHVLVLEAMEANLNVICEKNLCSNIEQARMMVKAMDKYPHLSTATGWQTRYFSKNWTPRKYLLEHKEELGKITSMNFTAVSNWGRTRFGWRRWLPDIFLEDMAPHHLDYIRYLSGMDVVQVQGAVNFKPSFSHFKGSSTTFAILALAKPEDYSNPDNWVYVTYRGDWQKKGENYTKFETHCENGEIWLYEHDKKKEVKVFHFDDEEGVEFHEENLPLDLEVEYNDDEYSDQVLILEQMSQSINSQGKNQPPTNFRDAIKTYSIVYGIQESSKNNKAIYLPEYWNNLNI